VSFPWCVELPCVVLVAMRCNLATRVTADSIVTPLELPAHEPAHT